MASMCNFRDVGEMMRRGINPAIVRQLSKDFKGVQVGDACTPLSALHCKLDTAC